MQKIYCTINIYLLLFLSLVFVPVVARAHQDRIIVLQKNGELLGFPSQYQPAKLNLDEMQLRIGKNAINFPPCISKYFEASGDHEIFITSSWYHNTEPFYFGDKLIPPIPRYININLKPREESFSFSLLFNLDTLEPIEFSIETHVSKYKKFDHEILISDMCKKSIRESISKK